MSERGAQAAYRGYRLQALYTLKRVLASGGGNLLVFHPEGKEDLDIEENDGRLLEAVQVKSYTNLVLSDLSPEKKTSFFRRALDLVRLAEHPRVVLVNFGHFGEEIRRGWDGSEEYRTSITEKLKGFNYQDEEIQTLFRHIELVEVDEAGIRDEVYSQIQEQIIGVDPESAFDLLHFWLYLRAEKQSRIAYSEIITKIQGVGRFLSERFHHHQEWFTSIQPIEDQSIDEEQSAQLRDEFYRGVSARYEHILASLDFHRDQKMVEIAQGFDRKNVVIIHAASGQGKSALAYRYLHEVYPDQWRFSVQLVENRQHALKIAAALAGHANAVQAPMAVFVDVSPRDTGWVDLVGQLSHHPSLQILVAVREEDYHRANIAEDFDYVPVDLTFQVDEARLIYERAQEAHLLAEILTFDDAWHSFGDDGPLMEFVYLLTQTETLHQRLEGQINRLRHEVRDKNLSSDELQLLRLVSVATAYDARLKITDLITLVNLPEPGLTLDLFEKEYLLRLTPDKAHISGLHPIRSRILSQLLTEPGIFPWEDSARQTLPITLEEEWEAFILQAFIDHPEAFQEILDIVTGLRPKSWTGLAGVLRCLLWAGVRRYIEENWDQVMSAQELFGQAWHFIMDLNFAGEEAPSLEGWWKNLGEIITEEKQKEIERVRRSQSPKENAFQLAIQWLNSIDNEIETPNSSRDWDAVSEMLYWSSRWGLSGKVGSWITDEAILSAAPVLSLDNLSELFLGIYETDQEKYSALMNATRTTIEERLAQEFQIIAIEDKDGILFIHFLTYPEESAENITGTKVVEKSVHDRTIERLQLIRQLFPNYLKYGSQGYGHQITGLGFDHDDSTKTGVDLKYLLPKWPIRLNGIATGVVQYRFRPDKWDDYFQQIIHARQLLVACISPLSFGISRYFSREKPFNLLSTDLFQRGEWDDCLKQVSNIPLLPKPAVDPWGMAQPEGKALGDVLSLQSLLPASVLDQIYNPYLDSERKYFSAIRNFMDQSLHVIATNYNAGKLPENSPQKLATLQALTEKGININLGFLSFFNLSESRDALSNYQANFRQLFGHRIKNDLLTSLEHQENEVFKILWPLWYYFAIQPRTSVSNPLRQIPARIENLFQNILGRIMKALETVRGEGIRSIVVRESMKWDDSPSVFILVDVEDTTLIYPKVEEMIKSLRESVGVVPSEDLEYKLIEERIRFIVIVVTVRGKMINSLVWPLRTVFTITTHTPIEEKQWAFIPQELHQILNEELELTHWKDEEIDIANQVSAAISGLNLLLSLMSKIKDMPEPTEAGLHRIETFMEDRSKELSNLLQLFIDSGTKLLDKFNRLSEDEQAERTYLSGAVALLNDIYKDVLPGEDFKSQQRLDMNGVVEYVDKLQDAVNICETIKIYWIEDIIENNECGIDK
ncbi:MAG: hypothetical protein A2Z14_10405 [Chloroflexi bacterium RBG_16_48_8]|nr:MAG: hypothetical protein A2Z14_10405 [Chloroflexi bacterium RBG_16_48_8]